MFGRWIITAWTVLWGIVPCAGLGHQHATGTRIAADHDARPHVHLAGHHHHHAECKHAHKHEDEHEHAGPTVGPERQHDADAVYLPGGVGQGVRAAVSELSADGRLVACLPSDAAEGCGRMLTRSVDPGGGAGKRFAGCPLYLQVRALRL